ncbi:hypothetical protein NDU88_005759 [Pleurodeles waltl]|uniref:Uncharacterized protein n=1 Tax=Pleurodeles waltl TaxID=8319 RepID=A0AAV7SML5_PLEWA|nr:hypothetical protein NDU88_005759 [Pleurodeles waltl]
MPCGRENEPRLQLRPDPIVPLGLRRAVARQNYDETQVSYGEDTVPFTSLEEYSFLQQNQTGRADYQDEEKTTAQEKKGNGSAKGVTTRG